MPVSEQMQEKQVPLDSDAGCLPVASPASIWRSVLLEWGLIGAGGVVGTLMRVLISLTVGHALDRSFPWDIAIINISGAFLIGFLAGWRDPDSRTHELLWLAGAVGFLGAYTTFSSFALGIVTLAANSKTFLSLLYLSGSVGAGLLAVEVGLKLGSGRKKIRPQ